MGRGMSGSYLEPDREGYDDSEDEGGISLTAIKNKYKRGGVRGITILYLLAKSHFTIIFRVESNKIRDHLYIRRKKTPPILKIGKRRNWNEPKHCETRMKMTMKPVAAERKCVSYPVAVKRTVIRLFILQVLYVYFLFVGRRPFKDHCAKGHNTFVFPPIEIILINNHSFIRCS